MASSLGLNSGGSALSFDDQSGLPRPRSRGCILTATDRVFAGSIPEIYDRFLVPLIFESYARDLAVRVAAVQPYDVLETAAGTGVLTRALAESLPAGTRILATDLNRPMLDRAAAR